MRFTIACAWQSTGCDSFTPHHSSTLARSTTASFNQNGASRNYKPAVTSTVPFLRLETTALSASVEEAEEEERLSIFDLDKDSAEEEEADTVEGEVRAPKDASRQVSFNYL